MQTQAERDILSVPSSRYSQRSSSAYRFLGRTFWAELLNIALVRLVGLLQDSNQMHGILHRVRRESCLVCSSTFILLRLFRNCQYINRKQYLLFFIDYEKNPITRGILEDHERSSTCFWKKRNNGSFQKG